MFTILMIIGFLILIYCRIKRPELVRVEWNKVANFSAILFLLFAIRMAIMELSPISQGYMPGFFSLPLVIWEDAVFGLSIFFLKEKFSKKIWIPGAILISLLFGFGHIAYGLTWAAITLIYPYFISYRYGKKVGFGTVGVCHILYDFTTVLAVKLSVLFKLMSQSGF